MLMLIDLKITTQQTNFKCSEVLSGNLGRAQRFSSFSTVSNVFVASKENTQLFCFLVFFKLRIKRTLKFKRLQDFSMLNTLQKNLKLFSVEYYLFFLTSS